MTAAPQKFKIDILPVDDGTPRIVTNLGLQWLEYMEDKVGTSLACSLRVEDAQVDGALMRTSGSRIEFAEGTYFLSVIIKITRLLRAAFRVVTEMPACSADSTGVNTAFKKVLVAYTLHMSVLLNLKCRAPPGGRHEAVQLTTS